MQERARERERGSPRLPSGGRHVVRGDLDVVVAAERRGWPVGAELVHLHPEGAHVVQGSCRERGGDQSEARGQTSPAFSPVLLVLVLRASALVRPISYHLLPEDVLSPAPDPRVLKREFP